VLVARIQTCISASRFSEAYVLPAFYGIIGILYNQFMDLSNSAIECVSVMINTYPTLLWDCFIGFLHQCQAKFLKSCEADVDAIAESSTEANGLELILSLLLIYLFLVLSVVNMYHIPCGWVEYFSDILSKLTLFALSKKKIRSSMNLFRATCGQGFLFLWVSNYAESFSSDLVKRFYLFHGSALSDRSYSLILSLLLQALQKIPAVAESHSRQIVPLFLKFLGYKDENSR